MSEEFSLVDCTFAPILWRLPSLGVELRLNRHGVSKTISIECLTVTFQASLSEAEREMPRSQMALILAPVFTSCALYDWIIDGGEDPYVIVDSLYPGVEVPDRHVKDGQIILNLASSVGWLVNGRNLR